MKSSIIVYSYYHSNTRKMAEVFGKVLDAQVKSPKQNNSEELQHSSLLNPTSYARSYSAEFHPRALRLLICM